MHMRPVKRCSVWTTSAVPGGNLFHADNWTTPIIAANPITPWMIVVRSSALILNAYQPPEVSTYRSVMSCTIQHFPLISFLFLKFVEEK